jgi:hypothetical protein
MEALKQGDNIVVFPEDSKNGYLEQLEGFFAGFVMLAEVCYKRGMDVPIFVTYFRRKDLKYIIDAPIKYSELAKGGATRADIAKRLLDRCNELGRMTFDKSEKVEQKELNVATK